MKRALAPQNPKFVSKKSRILDTKQREFEYEHSIYLDLPHLNSFIFKYEHIFITSDKIFSIELINNNDLYFVERDKKYNIIQKWKTDLSKIDSFLVTNQYVVIIGKIYNENKLIIYDLSGKKINISIPNNFIPHLISHHNNIIYILDENKLYTLSNNNIKYVTTLNHINNISDFKITSSHIFVLCNKIINIFNYDYELTHFIKFKYEYCNIYIYDNILYLLKPELNIIGIPNNNGKLLTPSLFESGEIHIYNLSTQSIKKWICDDANSIFISDNKLFVCYYDNLEIYLYEKSNY